MTIQDWNVRYRTSERTHQARLPEPTPLLKYWSDQLAPGKALDLACGTGRNALYLAAKGWKVEAVDGAETAIAHVCVRAQEMNVSIQTAIVDLTTPDYVIRPESWDLLAVCHYLLRDLFPAIGRGVRMGGLVIAVVHLVDEGGRPTETRAAPGELLSHFADFDIRHYYEGESKNPAHRRRVAEIAASKKIK